MFQALLASNLGARNLHPLLTGASYADPSIGKVGVNWVGNEHGHTALVNPRSTPDGSPLPSLSSSDQITNFGAASKDAVE